MTTPDSKLTVRTATQTFRVRKHTLRRLLRDGSVIGAQPVGSGREWLIPRKSLERLGLELRANPTSGAKRWPIAAAVGLVAVVALLVVAFAVTGDDDSTVAATPENASSTSPNGQGDPDGADVDSTGATTVPSTTSSTTIAPLPIGPPAPPSTTAATLPDAPSDPEPEPEPEPEPAPQPDPAPDDADPDAPDAGGRHEVVAGDNLWSIAAQTVRAQTPDATDADVFHYWQAVIDLNADQLVEAGNPDLILPGQQITLPSTSIVGGPVAASP